jgi:hypothetical protein
MPKDPHFVMTKSDPYGKSRKSRKKRRAARRPVPLASKRVSLPERIPAAPSAQVTLPIQQVVAQQPQVLGELKRIGIIAVGLLLLLIILSLVL